MNTTIPGWERKTAFVLRTLILLSGIYQTLFAEHAIGILTLICLALITLPGLYTRHTVKRFPIEIEILLFIMVLIQFVLGEARDLYVNIPYYDKIVHWMLPMFLGIIGFLIFYTLHATGKLKTSISAMMLMIILITLGIGAAWEIFEYSSDVLISPHFPNWPHFQGNAQQEALTDTMTDLIDDTLGAVFGSLLGLWVIGKNYSKNGRMTALINEMNDLFSHKQEAVVK